MASFWRLAYVGPWLVGLWLAAQGCVAATDHRDLTYVGVGNASGTNLSTPTPTSSGATQTLTALSLTTTALVSPQTTGNVTLRLRALDANGQGMPSAAVTLRVTRGPGTLATGTGFTDAHGLWLTRLAATAPGNVTVQAQVGTLSRSTTVTFARACSSMSFASPIALNANVYTGSTFGVGDLNADGAYDLAVTGSGNTLTTLINDGNGVLLPRTTLAHGDLTMDGIAERMVDMNSDGAADITTSYYLGGSIGVWAGDNTGNITGWTRFGYTEDQRPVVGDMDGDGLMDVSGSAYYSIRQTIAFGTARGLPANDTLVPLAIAGMSGGWTAMGDFNKDGYLDLVVGNDNTSTSAVAVLFNQGGRGFSSVTSVNVAPRSAMLASADFNQDGADDIVAISSTDLLMYVLLSDGVGGFAAPVSYPTNNTYGHPVTTDINGDGKTDIVVGLGSGAVILVYVNQGDGTFPMSPVQANSGDAGPAINVADFDGDGRVDIVTLAGSSAVLLMNTCQ